MLFFGTKMTHRSFDGLGDLVALGVGVAQPGQHQLVQATIIAHHRANRLAGHKDKVPGLTDDGPEPRLGHGRVGPLPHPVVLVAVR